MSTPSVTLRAILERKPDTGASVDTVLDSDVVLPLSLVSSSTTWKADTLTRKVIGASDTDVSFSVSNAKLLMIVADDDVLLKTESGGTANRGTLFVFGGKGTNAIRSSTWTFLISGNGSTPANISVYTLSP